MLRSERDECLFEPWTYGVETHILVRNVGRNIARFPPELMFQLSPEEFEALRSQIGISKRRHIKKVPTQK